jgi:hypothetical protein
MDSLVDGLQEIRENLEAEVVVLRSENEACHEESFMLRQRDEERAATEASLRTHIILLQDQVTGVSSKIWLF